MRIPNRHIMYKRYLDGEITETEYKTYLAEREEEERKASERFKETVGKLDKKNNKNNMEKSILDIENEGLYGYGTEEFSFAKVMPDSYWDNMASDDIDETMRKRLDLILDLINEYY